MALRMTDSSTISTYRKEFMEHDYGNAGGPSVIKARWGAVAVFDNGGGNARMMMTTGHVDRNVKKESWCYVTRKQAKEIIKALRKV